MALRVRFLFWFSGRVDGSVRLNTQAILVDQAAERWGEAVPTTLAFQLAVLPSSAAYIDEGSGPVADGTCFFDCPLTNSRLVRHRPCSSSPCPHHASSRCSGKGAVEVVGGGMERDARGDVGWMDCTALRPDVMRWGIDAVAVVAGPIDGMSARSLCMANLGVHREDRKRGWMGAGGSIRIAWAVVEPGFGRESCCYGGSIEDMVGSSSVEAGWDMLLVAQGSPCCPRTLEGIAMIVGPPGWVRLIAASASKRVSLVSESSPPLVIEID